MGSISSQAGGASEFNRSVSVPAIQLGLGRNFSGSRTPLSPEVTGFDSGNDTCLPTCHGALWQPAMTLSSLPRRIWTTRLEEPAPGGTPRESSSHQMFLTLPKKTVSTFSRRTLKDGLLWEKYSRMTSTAYAKSGIRFLSRMCMTSVLQNSTSARLWRE